MTKFKLSKRGVDNLSKFMDSIPMADFKTAKDVRLVTNIMKDLNESIADYHEMLEEYKTKQTEIFKKHRDAFLALPEEERDAKKPSADEAMKKEMDEIDTSELEAHQEMVIEVELGGDKYEKLKTLFNEHGTNRYQDKNAYLEVADALDL